MEHRFIITSYGRTGNNWLAVTLNRHQDIFVACGPDLEPSKTESYSQDDNRRMHRDIDRFFSTPPEEYFKILKDRGANPKVYGTIHSYGLHQAVHYVQRTKDRNCTVVNIIRHPVRRLQSLRNRWLYELGFNEFARARYHENFLRSHLPQPGIQQIKNEFGVDFEKPENWLFVNATLQVAQDANDFSVKGVPHIPMEHCVRDVEHFLWLFRLITGGIVELNDEFVEAIEITEKINRSGKFAEEVNADRQREGAEHAESNSYMIFKSWDMWQKMLFCRMLKSLKLAPAYHHHGYDLSFCKV